MKYFIFIILLFTQMAYAEKEVEITEGIHIFAGAGINFSAFKQSGDDSIYVAGSAFHADVSYFLNKKWSIESSAQVKFSDLNDILIWDSLFTLGTRYRFGKYNNLYARGYLGHSITVTYPNSSRSPDSSEFNRNHYEGQLLGMGLGKLFETEDKLKWFLEFNLTVQEINFVEYVGMDGERATVVDKHDIEDKTTVKSFMLTVGLLIF